MKTDIKNNLHSLTVGYGDFVKHIKEVKHVTKFKRHIDADLDFTGNWNYKTALEKSLTGWDIGIKKLSIENNLFDGVGTNIRPSYRGNRVNVGAFLRGEPKNMFRRQGVATYNRERLTVFVPLSYHGLVEADQAIDVAKKYMRKINHLQVNYDVKVVGVYGSTGHGTGIKLSNTMNLNIVIKDFTSRLVINNLAMAFHPAFFRRLIFKWKETFEFCDRSHGYTANNDLIDKFITDLLNTKNDKFVIFDQVNNLYQNDNDVVRKSNIKIAV